MLFLAPALLAALLPLQESRATRPASQSRPARGPRLVVLNKSDANVSFLDPIAGVDDRTPVGVGDGPHEAATSPDGRTAVVCNYGDQRPGNTLSVIDLRTRTVERTFTLEHLRPHGIAFLPDGKRIAVTSETSRRLQLLDASDGKLLQTIDTGAETSHMVALTPDGKRAFTANIRSGSISVLDLEAGKLVKVIPTGAGAEGIAVCPGRSEVWVANRAADTVSVVDVEHLTVVKTFPCAKFPIRVAFTPDGAFALVSCAFSGELAVFDTRTRELVRKVAFGKATVPAGEREGRVFGNQSGESPQPIGILIPPGGKVACVALANRDEICVLDLTTWQELRRVPTGHQPDGMTWAPEK